MKKKRFKTRLLAFLTVVLVLVPSLALSLYAYPAEQVYPPTETYTVGDIYEWRDEVVISERQITWLLGQLTYADTIVNVSPEFNSSVFWSYFSYQANVYINNIDVGHYTIGLYPEGGKFYLRLGYVFVIDGVEQSAYPIIVEVLPADSRCMGYQIVETDENNVTLTLEYISYSSDNSVVQSERYSFTMPSDLTKVTYSIKTEYCQGDFDYLGQYRGLMPSDLTKLQFAYDEGETEGLDRGYISGWTDGEQFGYDAGYIDGNYKAAVDSANSFDNMGKLIWTIVDMPFVMLQQVLNFDIFGINISTLVLGLLTIGLFIFVIRKVGII